MDKPFNERLRQLRNELELSQREVEIRANLPKSVVSRLERGRRDMRNLRVKDLEALAQVLRTSVGVLLGITEREVILPVSMQKLLIVPPQWRRHFQASVFALSEEIGNLPE